MLPTRQIIANDVSVTVTSCWGPAKQNLWFGVSRIKSEIPNQNSCSQAIPRPKYRANKKYSFQCVVNNKTLMVILLVVLTSRQCGLESTLALNVDPKPNHHIAGFGSPFVNVRWNPVEFVSYHQWNVHCKNTLSFSQCCWPRVPSDVRVTVTPLRSCWAGFWFVAMETSSFDII